MTKELEAFFKAAKQNAKELEATRAMFVLCNDEDVTHVFGTAGWDLATLREVILQLHEDLGCYVAKDK